MEQLENDRLLIYEKNYIFYIYFKNKINVDVEDAKKLSEFVLKHVVPDKNYAILMDIRQIKNMSRDAETFCQKDVQQNLMQSF